MSHSSTLENLREELASIDRKLLELVQARQETALRIGSIKAAEGKATRDFAQETRVIGRARATAEEVGLDAQIAEDLMLVLIRSSLAAQEQDRVASAVQGSGKKALIIGGAGKMGRWFARFLHSQGYSIRIADPSGPVPGFDHIPDWQRDSLEQDLIVVATPLGTSSEVLHALAKRGTNAVVFDVGSLKTPLRSGLQSLVDAGIQATSMHPMFGPDTDLLSGRHIIHIDLGSAKANEVAKELFASTMATQVEMDLDSHDRLIAYVLGLSHALNLAFTTALAESGEAAPKLAKLSSTTFDAQLKLATSVASENPQLYYEIQHLNDYGTEALTALLYAVERIRSVVRAGDGDAFVGIMEKAAAFVQSRAT